MPRTCRVRTIIHVGRVPTKLFHVQVLARVDAVVAYPVQFDSGGHNGDVRDPDLTRRRGVAAL